MLQTTQHVGRNSGHRQAIGSGVSPLDLSRDDRVGHFRRSGFQIASDHALNRLTVSFHDACGARRNATTNVPLMGRFKNTRSNVCWPDPFDASICPLKSRRQRWLVDWLIVRCNWLNCWDNKRYEVQPQKPADNRNRFRNSDCDQFVWLSYVSKCNRKTASRERRHQDSNSKRGRTSSSCANNEVNFRGIAGIDSKKHKKCAAIA